MRRRRRTKCLTTARGTGLLPKARLVRARGGRDNPCSRWTHSSARLEHMPHMHGVAGSNPAASTNQSLDFGTSLRIARNPRACARFAIANGPGERFSQRDSRKYAHSSLGAICLGPSGSRRLVSAHRCEMAHAIRLTIAIDNAQSPSHAAATERCVFATAATPKLPPEKENSHGNSGESDRCETKGDGERRRNEVAHKASRWQR
jgi:hypothetical protein